MRRAAVAIATAFCLATGPAVLAQDVVHIVAGIVTKVDAAAKTATIKTKDGVEVVASDVAAGAKAGSHAVVHYTESGGKSSVKGVKYVGSATVHESRGVITKVDAGAKTVAVKTAGGTTEVYHVAEDGVLSAGKAVGQGSADAWAGLDAAMKKSTTVTVQWTETAGKKTAHAFAHAF